MPPHPADLIRRYYGAYETDQRDVLEEMLSPDFRFSSPQDDAIDRATYFERCWPGHADFREFRLLQLAVDGDHALVRYEAIRHDGTGFQNVEHFEFNGQRIRRTDVYFGRPAGTIAQVRA
jgi:SnoaL-like domain